jgi:hypothetical protein
MLNTRHHYLVLLVAALLVPFLAAAENDGDNVTNRLSLSGRIGFNIPVHFANLSSLPAPSFMRRTPRGDAYNYDDGYVLTDISGNAGGQSWYWGYDNSAQQISGNTILLSRNSSVSSAGSSSSDDSPGYGAELVFNRPLFTKGNFHFGIEAAANYLNLSANDNSTLSANLARATSPYPFTPGTTPPTATGSSPYQGSFEGPGFLISDTPTGSFISTVNGGASIQGHREFDASLWGIRLGPNVELPLNERWTVAASVGFAIGFLNSDVSWNETAVVSGVRGTTVSGSGSASDVLFGFYAGATVSYQFSERWGAVVGVQYQNLGTYTHSFGGRNVQADFSNSIFISAGVSFSF